jgi:UDP-2,3-diacylglucosamine pyrophosphatase LpxH
VFFYRYVMRTQPLLVWTWFWGAIVTLIYSVGEGLLPAHGDPFTLDDRVEDIAVRSNATPRIVRSLRALHVHPAIFNPFQILRELWLDRALLLLLILFVSLWFFSVLNLFVNVSFWWFVIPFMLLMPLFIFYARSVESDVLKVMKTSFKAIPQASKITKLNRVIFGHTHRELHTWIDGVEHLNTGTWSPAFKDVECTQRFGRKVFAWIKPTADGQRMAELHEWSDPGTEIIMPRSVNWSLK